jgi:hypothetical protein
MSKEAAPKKDRDSKPETYEEYWLRQARFSEKALAVAQNNLSRIALRDQLQLFTMEAQIITFPLRVVEGDTAA